MGILSGSWRVDLSTQSENYRGSEGMSNKRGVVSLEKVYIPSSTVRRRVSGRSGRIKQVYHPRMC